MEILPEAVTLAKVKHQIEKSILINRSAADSELNVMNDLSVMRQDMAGQE